MDIEPTYLTRTDGISLLYPGRDSYLIGPADSGKTWIVCLAVAQCLAADIPVLVVSVGDRREYERRLIKLGLTEDQLSGFRSATADVLATAGSMNARVVVFEDVGGAAAALSRPLTALGRSVLVTGCPGTLQGRYAGGSAFELRNVAPIVPGQRGVSTLYATKDPLGQVKRHGRRTSRGDYRVGSLLVEDGPRDRTKVEIRPPDRRPRMVSPKLSDVELRAEIMRLVEQGESRGRLANQTVLRRNIRGCGEPRLDAEVSKMLADGLLSISDCDCGFAKVFRLVKPDRRETLEEMEVTRSGQSKR